MFRWALLAACVTCALGAAPRAAQAGDMDLALSRLRIARSQPNCLDYPSSGTFCQDQEYFERLMAELGVAMAPPVVGPARTIGARGFKLTFGTTLTGIEGGEVYWIRGTEGRNGLDRPADDLETPIDESDYALGYNESPQAVLAWNHVQVRKGLPFGFEAAALLGQGMNTSLWTVGAALKWSLFEGFRTGLGRLPDIALQTAISRSVGSSQATLHLYAFDLSLSKPFVVAQTWTVSPFLGLQFLLVDAESGVIDLTPGGPSAPGSAPAEDAFASCRPRPGHQTDPARTVVCMTGGTDADFANDVVFDPVRHSRLRMFLGGETRYQMFTFAASLLIDLTAPTIDAKPRMRHIASRTAAHQLAFSVSIGAVL